MIKLGNNNKLIAMYRNGQRILAVYTQGSLMWPEEIINEILSCFSNGYWLDEYPWADNDTWVD